MVIGMCTLQYILRATFKHSTTTVCIYSIESFNRSNKSYVHNPAQLVSAAPPIQQWHFNFVSPHSPGPFSLTRTILSTRETSLVISPRIKKKKSNKERRLDKLPTTCPCPSSPPRANNVEKSVFPTTAHPRPPCSPVAATLLHSHHLQLHDLNRIQFPNRARARQPWPPHRARGCRPCSQSHP